MILFLGPLNSTTWEVVTFLLNREPTLLTSDLIDLPFLDRHRPDFLISYNYSHKLNSDVLASFPPAHAINLHISLLPYNRGAHPNFWAWHDGTPHGVTIHVIDSGWDTGPILCQSPTTLDPTGTFASTYATLHRAMADLLRSNWADLRSGLLNPTPQPFHTKLHLRNDLTPYLPSLPLLWDTSIPDFLAAQRADFKEDAAKTEDSHDFWRS